jgi:hypothetical protein
MTLRWPSPVGERTPYVLVGFVLSRMPSGSQDELEDLKGSALSKTPV